MKKFWAILGILLIGLVLMAPMALAADSSEDSDFKIDNPINASTIPALIDKVAHFIFLVGVAIAPVMILVGAFYYMTAAGNPDKVGKANKIIIWTLVGVAILFMSDILISVIRNALGVAD